jgi:hypothetical protein
MIDPEVFFDLPLEEMSIGPTAPGSASPTRRDFSAYRKENHSAFHTAQDYRAAVRLFSLGYPKLKDLSHDKSKN